MTPTIAIQGIKGCFHEMAARKFFPEVEVRECVTFKEVCQCVTDGTTRYAVMAIENTLAGSLLPNYALIEKYSLRIIGEVYLPIRMNLLVLPDTTMTHIRKVMSHPVALAQCEEYLERFPHIQIEEYHDTAAAARFISEKKDPSVAAIASRLSAELYGLDILEESIETHKENFTRFLILSSSDEEISGTNKASLSLEVSHSPGSLADVLQIFKELEVNLTKIQSLPIIGKPYQYAFKIDVTWRQYEHFVTSLSRIRERGNAVKVYGMYREQDYQKD